MKIITVFDTSIASTNLGDQIIMDSIKRNLSELFPNDFFLHVPTHDKIAKPSYKQIKRSAFKFVGGTNLLASRMNQHSLWKVNLWDSFFVKDVILMGVGWCGYQEDPNQYTQWLLKRMLSGRYLHSVRDSYTAEKLKRCGISNVINTACPTMWGLTRQHCCEVPVVKAEEVLMTLTDYRKSREHDKQLFEVLARNYKKVYFWIQQPGDYPYMHDIAGDKVEYVTPSLASFDQILRSRPVDYVGTRLHAGVRALQHKRRSLILGVDNRALEIAKDTNLPVASRDDFARIACWINSPSATHITLPEENITKWKNQFR